MCQQRDNLETYGVLEATKEQRKSVCRKQWSNDEESEDDQRKKVVTSYTVTKFYKLFSYLCYSLCNLYTFLFFLKAEIQKKWDEMYEC